MNRGLKLFRTLPGCPKARRMDQATLWPPWETPRLGINTFPSLSFPVLLGEKQMERCFVYKDRRACLDAIDLVFLAFVALVALALLAVSMKPVPVTVRPIEVLTTTLALKT